MKPNKQSMQRTGQEEGNGGENSRETNGNGGRKGVREWGRGGFWVWWERERERGKQKRNREREGSGASLLAKIVKGSSNTPCLIYNGRCGTQSAWLMAVWCAWVWAPLTEAFKPLTDCTKKKSQYLAPVKSSRIFTLVKNWSIDVENPAD